MALTFSWSIRVNGTLANADSAPTLADSTNTYGIKRLDTNAVVVNAGTAATNASTGVYTYTIESPVTGVTYRAVLKAIVSGKTIYATKNALDGSGDAAGYYASLSDLNEKFGDVNLITLSRLDNDSSSAVDSTRIQAALDYADQTIDRYIRRNGYQVPVATTSRDFGRLTDAACYYATNWLYMRRRWRDEVADEMKGLADSYSNEADSIVADLVRFGIDATRFDGDSTSLGLAIA